MEEYRQRLIDAGVKVSEIVTQMGDDGRRMIRAFYFQDPDGVTLEMSSWSPVAEVAKFEPAHAADAVMRRTGRVAITT